MTPTASPTLRADDAARFADDLAAFDALTVCSPEDLALVAHRRAVCIGNGAHIASTDCRPSEGSGILFIGPFRYRPNRDGIVRFLRDAWPAVRAAVPSATLTILGGDEHAALVAANPRSRNRVSRYWGTATTYRGCSRRAR